jgi:IclR family pca regulon transcriptional regulator
MAAGETVSSIRPDREYVGGLAHGLRVIEAFDEAHSEMTLSEVARRTGLSPATARRSLHTLATLGYVRSIKGRYALSARILFLGSAYLRASAAQDILEPELRSLVGKFGDTAGVGILLGGNVLYVAYHSIPRGMRPMAGAGVAFPAYATSLGRVLLAGMADAEVETWLHAVRFEKLTELTETDPNRLSAIVRDVRRAGYSTIRDELFYGITSLGVPVVNAAGNVVAALNTSGYSGLVTPEQLIEDRLQHLQRAAVSIAGLMDRHPALLNSFVTGGETKYATPILAARPRNTGMSPPHL